MVARVHGAQFLVVTFLLPQSAAIAVVSALFPKVVIVPLTSMQITVNTKT